MWIPGEELGGSSGCGGSWVTHFFLSRSWVKLQNESILNRLQVLSFSCSLHCDCLFCRKLVLWSGAGSSNLAYPDFFMTLGS
jgi:hypothetical protein